MSRSSAVGFGPIVLGKLARMGVQPVAYRWWYDPALHRANPFKLHRRLHARVIAFIDFPVPEHGFPLGLFPGDHFGCRCVLAMLFRGPDGRFLRRFEVPASEGRMR